MASVSTRSKSKTGDRRPPAASVPLERGRAPFDQSAAMVLGEFQHAVEELFRAAPREIRKIADVEEAFGVHHLLAWQLFRIVQAQNPLAVGAHMPAEVSMGKLLASAARRKVAADVVERVERAFEAFERFVEAEAGDREELQGMLTAFLPEERRKQDLANREAAFKAMSQVRGAAIETAIVAMIYRASADGTMVDRVSINADLGVRRVKPEARIVIQSGDQSRPANPVLDLDGKPVGGPFSALLPEFSTNPTPRIVTRESDGTVYYRLAGDDVGMRSAIDLVTADQRAGTFKRYYEPGTNRVRGVGYTFDTPARRATLDVFVHKDLWPNVRTRLAVYSTARLGMINFFGEPRREDDLLITHDEIRALPVGIQAVRVAHYPRYIELLEHVFGRVGWEPSEFRGYRLDVQYPLYASQYCMGFEVPDAPGA